MKQRFLLLALIVLLVGGVNAQTTGGLLYNFKFNGNIKDSLNSTTGFDVQPGGLFPPYTADRLSNPLSAYALATKTTANLPLLPQGKSARTISLWFNLNYGSNTNGYEQILFSYGTEAANQAFGFSIQPSNNTAKVFGWVNDFTFNYPFARSTWYNLVLTYNGVTLSAYVNGALVLTQPVSIWNTTGTTFCLGETPGSSLRSYNNIYDDVRIYDRVLNNLEILGLYGTSINVNSLKQSVYSYYSFDSNLSNHNNELPFSEYFSSPIVAGYKGNARAFTGSNCLYTTDYTSFFDETAAAKPFTISFWSKAQGYNSYATMFELYGSYFARYRSTGGALEFGYQASNLNWYTETTGSSVINYNNWQHITLVHSPANQIFALYINGIYIEGGANFGLKINKANSKITFGGGTDASGNFLSSKSFTGAIDELYFFDKVLKPEEIQYLYNNSDLMVATDIRSQKISPKMNVFPNPCMDVVYFENEENSKKQIWSLVGNKLIETTESSVDVSCLPSGTYVVKFVENNQVKGVAKMIKK